MLNQLQQRAKVHTVKFMLNRMQRNRGFRAVILMLNHTQEKLIVWSALILPIAYELRTFQAFRVAVCIAGMDIFHTKHCRMHLAEYFPDCLAFFFTFFLGQKGSSYQAIRSEMAFSQWRIPCQSDEAKYAFIDTTVGTAAHLNAESVSYTHLTLPTNAEV